MIYDTIKDPLWDPVIFYHPEKVWSEFLSTNKSPGWPLSLFMCFFSNIWLLPYEQEANSES